MFDTPRLRVGPWHLLADTGGLDLESVVTGILTEATTQALPEAWRGDFSLERARDWIGERDGESPTLLVVERQSARPAGLLILFEIATVSGSVDVRIGYLFAEDAWGRGLATELVAGLIAWARSHPAIETLTGGVDPGNPASARVLIKNGFERVADTHAGDIMYELNLG